MARIGRPLLALCVCALIGAGVWAAVRRSPPPRRPAPAPPAAEPAPLPTGLGRLLPPLPGAVPATGFGWTERAGRPVFQPYVVFAAPAGAEWRAVAAGTVAAVRDDPETYGLYVEVVHPLGWSSVYGGCARILAEPGRAVRPGSAVCAVAGAGGAAFALLFRGHPVNPAPYLGVAG